jgi:hypothetical protein
MNKNMLKMFFDSIFPNLEGFIEVRYKVSKEQDIVKRRFFSSKERLIQTLIKSEERIKRYDMWFGVCERAIQSGKKEAIEKVCCLWADIDSEEHTWKDFEYLPHIVVKSGHGYHLYWLIELVKISSIEDVDKIEGILKGIAEKLRSDHATDLSRCMRIPETYNNKDKIPIKAEIIEFNFDLDRYNISDFEKYYIPKVSVDTTKQMVEIKSPPKITAEDLKKYNLPKWVEEAITQGFEYTPSHLDISIMMELLKKGLSDDEIYAIYHNPDFGLSRDKMRKKIVDGVTYFEYTLAKAKSYQDYNFRQWVEKIKKFRDFEEVINVYKKWFHIEDPDYLKVIHAVVMSHLIDAKPLWILTVAPPSGTKTSVLQDLVILNKYNVQLVSEVTQHTFVSGDKNYSGLLSMVKNAVLVFKDFTTILQMSADTRNEILQQIREIYDGYYKKYYGTGKKVEWQGKITILAGCTEVYEVYRQIDQTLGERFLFYRPPAEQRQSLALRSLHQISKEKQMHKEIQEAIKTYHDSIDPDVFKEVRVDEDILKELVKIADVVTLLRSGVKRDHRKEVEYIPSPEVPARLSQQLYVLLIAVAVLNKHLTATNEELVLAKKVGLMTVPYKKYRIVKYFLDNNNFTKKTSEIASDLGFPHSTTYYLLEDMWCFKILQREGMEHEAKWYLSKDFYNLIADVKLPEINNGDINGEGNLPI